MAEIEYFYAAHSAFAYLGSARLMQIADTAGRNIVHRPMDLNRVIAAVGATPFKDRETKHRAYYFRREIERWAEHRNLPVMPTRPTHHRRDITLANCMLIAAITQGQNVDRLANEMLSRHWEQDADLSDSETLSAIAHAVDVDPAPLLEAADSAAVRAAYEANTQEAIDRSVFGSPTYFVDGDMFYGQDRLDLVERALKKPYGGTWPKSSAD